ncbi:MAG TPA: 16S rRNA (cytosine(1402)-N(4))-methyltransferase RsmH [Pirellulaceae bacterium]|nr:16S rRNA (cytosine(1402)-N(4))-methyltransferase RsmH [Pirellulaceae bacterium]
MPTIHVPVLPREVLEWLAPRPGETMVDGTLGGCGHTRMLVDAVGMNGQVISFDRDPRAIEEAEKLLKGLPVKLAEANFCELRAVLDQLGIAGVDGVLLDLGLSSDQLADRERGFSFDSDGPLDLRFNTEEGESAAQLIHRMREEPLANLIYEFGEERLSRRIARRIVEVRRDKPIHTARELADIVRKCVPRSPKDKIDPATRTFQALRIAVNDELGSLDRILRDLPSCLNPGGRAAIISFHSLEDRRVKEAFRGYEGFEILTKKPVVASDQEVAANPRSRSAKLRVARKHP